MSFLQRVPERRILTLWLGFALIMGNLLMGMGIFLLALWRQDLSVLLICAGLLLTFIYRAPAWVAKWCYVVQRHYEAS